MSWKIKNTSLAFLFIFVTSCSKCDIQHLDNEFINIKEDLDSAREMMLTLYDEKKIDVISNYRIGTGGGMPVPIDDVISGKYIQYENTIRSTQEIIMNIGARYVRYIDGGGLVVQMCHKGFIGPLTKDYGYIHKGTDIFGGLKMDELKQIHGEEWYVYRQG